MEKYVLYNDGSEQATGRDTHIIIITYNVYVMCTHFNDNNKSRSLVVGYTDLIATQITFENVFNFVTN